MLPSLRSQQQQPPQQPTALSSRPSAARPNPSAPAPSPSSIPSPSLGAPRPAPRKGPNPFLLLGILAASSISFLVLSESHKEQAKTRPRQAHNPLLGDLNAPKTDLLPRRPAE